jgi:hypothetical protein
VDVYCGNGDRLPLGSTFTVEPHQTSDIRIDGATTVAVLCWARVAELSGAALSGIQLRAFLETLSGNQLEDFDRQPGQAIENSTWALPAMEVAGQQLYVLNASDKPTMLTFCAANKLEPKACERKSTRPARQLLNPKQAVLVNVQKFRQKYLITESSKPGRAIVQVFSDLPGRRRFFSSESSISFGTPDQ